MSKSNPIHLPDLHIEGFRGIDKLHIPRLGRVTLLVGRNGIGKTTVLEAVRIYASRGDHPVLREILLGREEYSHDEGVEERISIPDVDALFHGRDNSHNGRLSIGPSAPGDQLRIEVATQDELLAFLNQTQRMPAAEMWIAEGRSGVKVAFGGWSKVCPLGFPFRVPTRDRFTASKIGMRCETVGPGTLSNQEMAWLWDSVALTDDEKVALESLNLMLNSGSKGDAVIGVHAPEVGRSGRHLMVRLKSTRQARPITKLR